MTTEVRDSVSEIEKRKSAVNLGRRNDRAQRSSALQQTNLKTIAGKNLKDKVDDGVSSFFFEENIPFRKVESPSFKKLVDAVRCSGPNYQLPNRKRLSGALLDDSFTKMKTTLA